MQDICYVTHVKGSFGPKGIVTHRMRPTALETAIFLPKYESSDRQHRVVLTFLQKDECFFTSSCSKSYFSDTERSKPCVLAESLRIM